MFAVVRPLLCALLCALGAVRPAGADDVRGWAYLVDRLAADGVERAEAVRVFSDPRVDAFDGLAFGLEPREPHSLYRGFLRATSIAAARRCRLVHATPLEAAERRHGVPADLIAAILYVETGCGRNTGSSRIVHRLARLAMANEPANLRANLLRLAGADPSPALEARVRARARYLEDTFYPEVRAVFVLAERLRMHPLELRGSSSGAFGTPQFLPTSYLRYGNDAGGDGHVDLYDVADGAASCANYLASHGWRSGLSERARRDVIWRYNRSDAYIDAVLGLARRIDQPVTVLARPARRKAPARTVARPSRKRPARPVARARTEPPARSAAPGTAG